MRMTLLARRGGFSWQHLLYRTHPRLKRRSALAPSIGMRRGETAACLGGERTPSWVAPTASTSQPPPGRDFPSSCCSMATPATAKAQALYFDLDSAVERRGFILVKPNLARWTRPGAPLLECRATRLSQRPG